MKLKVNYFDNQINITEEQIFSIEILNKKYFYRLVNDLLSISNNSSIEEIVFYDNNEIINLCNKINVITQYFEFDFDSKKYNNNVFKYVCNSIGDIGKSNILKYTNKLYNSINKELQSLELPLTINTEETFENIIKSLKLVINKKSELLDNLLLLIDIEKSFNLNDILVFVNLKQLLSNAELKELYKYAIYNGMKILMIDSISYKNKIKYENKLIIDDDLTEFMIQCYY